jgi:hypothetical protein
MAKLEPRATMDPPRAIRIKTSTGWADLAIAGTPGYPSTVGKLADVLTVTADGAAPTWQPPAPSGADLEYNGTYDPAKTYNDGDFVVDANGITYCCVMDGTKGIAPAPWSSGQWGVPQPPVAGQWLKGSSGGAVWAPVTGYSGGVSITAANTDLTLPDPAVPVTTLRINTGGGSIRSIQASSSPGAMLILSNGYGTAPVTMLNQTAGGTGNQLIFDVGANCVLPSGHAATFACSSGPYWVCTGITPSAAGPSYATTLPASPGNGQEATLVKTLDAAADPPFSWRFRYNAGSSRTEKWEFIGGTPAYLVASQGQWTAMAAGWSLYNPTYVVPRSGVYDVEFGGQFQGATGSLIQYSINPSGGAAPTGEWCPGPQAYVVHQKSRTAVVGAGASIQLWLYAGDGSCQFANVYAYFTPVRVA